MVWSFGEHHSDAGKLMMILPFLWAVYSSNAKQPAAFVVVVWFGPRF